MNKAITTSVAPNEAGVLASEMNKAFGERVQMYEKHFSLTREEAIRRAVEPPVDGGERTLNGPPDEVSWSDLHLIGRTDPDRAIARWEANKEAALAELQSGHRAAKAVETVNGDAWVRAQFLALRKELADDWQPRNGIERQLIDTMVQAQVGYLTWLQTVTIRTSLGSVTNARLHKDEGKWAPSRQSDADALEQAAAMMDRYNRIFLRTLRALCDMRRHCSPVIVQNGGQMNVAQQQVNLSASIAPSADSRRERGEA